MTVPDDPVGRAPDPTAADLTAGDPLGGLWRWLAEARVDDAAADRSRQGWLAQQASQGAQLLAMLLDLGERGDRVVVATTAGRRVRGPVKAVGSDFVVVHEERLGNVVVPARAIATVRPAPGQPGAAGDRPLGMAVSIVDALAELAVDRPTVLVVAGPDEVRGELRGAGHDVVTIVLEAPAREQMHVSLAGLDHLAVVLS